MEPIVKLCMIALDRTGARKYLESLLIGSSLNRVESLLNKSEIRMNESTIKLQSQIKAQKLLINDFHDTFARLE